MGHPPVAVADLCHDSEVEPVGNHNSILHICNSHRNRDHCSRLDNPRNRNTRNRNL